MKTYNPENCKECAWSFESYVYGGKIVCALTEEYGCIKDVNTTPEWCPLDTDKRFLDDTKPDVV